MSSLHSHSVMFPPILSPEVVKDATYFEGGLKLLKRINPNPNLSELVARLTWLAADACGSKMGALFVLDQKAGELRAAVGIGLPSAYLKGCDHLALGAACCGRAALYRKPWFTSDVLSDRLFAESREAALESGVMAALSVPVILNDGRCIGTLSNHFRQRYTPTQTHIERNEIYAQLVAFAIENYVPKKRAKRVKL